MAYCGLCQDHGVVGGDRPAGPDARWCNCAAAYQLRETEPNYVERINQARAKLKGLEKTGLRKLSEVIEETYHGDF